MHLTTVNNKEDIDMKEIRDSYMEKFREKKRRR